MGTVQKDLSEQGDEDVAHRISVAGIAVELGGLAVQTEHFADFGEIEVGVIEAVDHRHEGGVVLTRTDPAAQ
ncbi:hypothetical protein AB0F85_13530 [Nocardia fluminea]|uniref:hypothetical protein n=1 Tax=Nocardia fluminea TaxID=134984 RepID=UPI00340A8D6E